AWLGVDALWLSPIFPSPMKDFGYDVADYCDVDPRFGSLAELDRLIAEAHTRGLRVLVDWVPDHTSDRHPWFVGSRRSRPGAHEREAWVVRLARSGSGRRSAQQLVGGLPTGDARVDARPGDRPVLPASLPARAARPRLVEPRCAARHARRAPVLARPRRGRL